MTRSTQPKTALITGVTGHDGACLAELLLAKGHVVRGIQRRAGRFDTGRIDRPSRAPHVDLLGHTLH